MTITGILLAAGRSTRFGAADKLAALLQGRPILHHAAQAMRDLSLDARFIVRSDETDDTPDGFDTVKVAAGGPMSRSLAAGIAAARATGADAALVMLADMPFVTSGHLRALIGAAEGAGTLLASVEAGRPSPPALFGRDWFDTLENAIGDAGGRALIRQARLISAPPGSLVDIDTIGDLGQAEASVRSLG